MAIDNARPDYGIDAPGLVRVFFLIGAGCLMASALTAIFAGQARWGGWVFWSLSILAIYPVGMGVLMVFWSRVTKVRERELLLNMIRWTGKEQVLDVGCGRGLMLVGAARRLTSGTATGIDIWQAADQSANAADGAVRNAAIEGVSDRVDVLTADMRSLPFEDGVFDVIVSHWAVHNIEVEAERALALSEMVRVLRHDGTILLADIENRLVYADRLAALGLTDQQTYAPPLRDAVLGAISFGSFKPAAIVARR